MPPPPIIIEYDGKRQTTVEWSRETGIRLGVINGRHYNGWPPEEIFTTPLGEKRKSYTHPGNRILEFDGRSMSVTQWAEEVGLTASNILGRLKLGWDIFDVLMKPVYPRNARGRGQRRKSARNYMPPHLRPGFRPKPMDGCCEKCHRPSDLHGDHDPLTGRFRGWLCFHCNTGIGKLGDNIEGLREAIAYLEKATTA